MEDQPYDTRSHASTGWDPLPGRNTNTVTMQQIASTSQAPPHTILYPNSPTSSLPIKNYSRPLTTPIISNQPIPIPVQVDNFAAPRSDSPIEIRPGGGFSPLTHRRGISESSTNYDNRRSGVGLPEMKEIGRRTSRDGEEILLSDDLSTHRFTLGEDSYAYNNNSTAAGKRKPTLSDSGRLKGGWDEEKNERKKRRKFWWAIVAIVLVGLIIGLSVGLTRKRGNHENINSAPDGLDSNSASDMLESTTSATNSVETVSSSQTSNSDRSTAATATRTSRATNNKNSATATGGVADAVSSALAIARTDSSPDANFVITRFAYGNGGKSTEIAISYTIPTEGVETRENGQLQFTQAVVLPRLGATKSNQVFTSQVRFRVEPTTTREAKTTTTSMTGEEARKRVLPRVNSR